MSSIYKIWNSFPRQHDYQCWFWKAQVSYCSTLLFFPLVKLNFYISFWVLDILKGLYRQHGFLLCMSRMTRSLLQATFSITKYQWNLKWWKKKSQQRICTTKGFSLLLIPDGFKSVSKSSAQTHIADSVNISPAVLWNRQCAETPSGSMTMNSWNKILSTWSTGH